MEKFKCIYCLSTEPEVRSSLSHVIPTSLGGTVELEMAVCTACNSRINRETEEPFLRDWGFLLNILGIRSRRGKVPRVQVTVLSPGGERFPFTVKHIGREDRPIIKEDAKGKIHIIGPEHFVKQEQEKYEKAHPGVQWKEQELSGLSSPDVEFEIPVAEAGRQFACRLAAKVAFERWCLLRSPQEVMSGEYDAIRDFVSKESEITNSPICQLFFHERIVRKNFNVPFPLHAILLFSDPGAGRLGALVSFFGLVFYWVRLSDKYGLAASWDDLILVYPQTGEVNEPAIRGSLRAAGVPWNELVSGPERQAEVIQRTGRYIISKLNEALRPRSSPNPDD